MTAHLKHHLRLFLIVIGTMLYFIANIHRVAIPGAVFDLLQGDFSACATRITLLGAIFCYIYAIVQLVVGLMVDKLGGFRVIAIGAVVFTIGSLLFPYSDNLLILYLSRALVGFGSATFYLSLIREVKKYAKDKNFSLAVSYILFVGYSGGIFANAPLVYAVNQIGWRHLFGLIGMFTLVFSVAYIVTLTVFRPVKCEKEVKFSIAPFKEILSNRNNINLYLFGSLNYGVYYVLQSVIGKKFLEDYCLITTSNAALILSLMAIISSFAGTITAFISKSINNKRAVIFKIFSLLAFFSMLSIFIMLCCDVHSKITALIFCIPSYIGSISPLLILTLHMYNRYEVSATAVSIQNFGFFMMVGFLGMLVGMLMNRFEPLSENGILVYSRYSYLLVFALFLILTLVEVYCAFKIKDKN